MRQLEENLTEFLDEIYEHQARTFPGGDWKPDNPRYVDSVRKNIQIFRFYAVVYVVSCSG